MKKTILFLVAFTVLSTAESLYAQSTAFTYQGRLNVSGSAANGLYDFRFRLASDPLANNYVGSPYLTNAISVTNGLFTTMMNFGNIFTGSNYWLEVDVRTNGSGSYTMLNPLQAVTPAPSAIYAATAGSVAGGFTIQQNTNGAPNVIEGASVNYVSNGVVGATISGGGATNFSGMAFSNSVTAFFGTVGGGAANIAGAEATVSGGVLNTAGVEATVGGGYTNVASGNVSVVSGGAQNTASGASATVGGGSSNTATNTEATVGGGAFNNAGGFAATVSGGVNNTANGSAAVVSGGQNNLAGGDNAVTSGGYYNNANGYAATVSGGSLNSVSGYEATVSGGYSNNASGYTATVSGGYINSAGNYNATVSGGALNAASGYGATVSGGYTSVASAQYATVSGGALNAASGYAATVSGGYTNVASGQYATVSGGYTNVASGTYTTVTGGDQNVVSGNFSTVDGGINNLVSGGFSFAAGSNARATNNGAFVWSDPIGQLFYSTVDNQFSVRATGGVRFVSASSGNNPTAGVSLAPGGGSWSSLSDRNAKENFQSVDAGSVLSAVTAMPLTIWNYKTQAKSIRHIGPMAQDFYAAFSVGEDDKHITEIDESGVALAAIQALAQKLEAKDAQIETLQKRNQQLGNRLEKLELLVGKLGAEK